MANQQERDRILNILSQKDVSWDDLSQNLQIPLDFVINNLNSSWNWYYISSRPDLDINYIKTNYDNLRDNLNWNIISLRKNLDWDFIMENVEYPWNWNILSKRIPWNVVKSKKDIRNHLDWNVLSRREDLDWDLIKIKLNWNWNIISERFPFEFLTNDTFKYILRFLNWGKISYRIPYDMLTFQFKKINWDIISKRLDIPWEFIKNSLDLPWNWKLLTIREDVDWQIIEYYPEFMSKWVSHSLISREDFDINMVLSYPEINWNWDRLSTKPNFNFIRNHTEIPWNWNRLSRMFTIDVIKKNIELPWNWDILSNNIVHKIRYLLNNNLIKTNLEEKLNWNIITKNMILLNQDEMIYCAYPKMPWDWTYLSNKVKIDNIIKTSELSWYWSLISLRQDITREQVIRIRDIKRFYVYKDMIDNKCLLTLPIDILYQVIDFV